MLSRDVITLQVTADAKSYSIPWCLDICTLCIIGEYVQWETLSYHAYSLGFSACILCELILYMVEPCAFHFFSILTLFAVFLFCDSNAESIVAAVNVYSLYKNSWYCIMMVMLNKSYACVTRDYLHVLFQLWVHFAFAACCDVVWLVQSTWCTISLLILLFALTNYVSMAWMLQW